MQQQQQNFPIDTYISGDDNCTIFSKLFCITTMMKFCEWNSWIHINIISWLDQMGHIRFVSSGFWRLNDYLEKIKHKTFDINNQSQSNFLINHFINHKGEWTIWMK